MLCFGKEVLVETSTHVSHDEKAESSEIFGDHLAYFTDLLKRRGYDVKASGASLFVFKTNAKHHLYG